MTPPEVLVAGGGLAALELVLGLRELAGDRVHVTIVSSEPDFVLRPRLATSALGATEPLRRPLAGLTGAEVVLGSLTAVEPHRIVLRSGDTLAFDTLVLATGVETLPAFDGAIHVGDPDAGRALETLREEVREGVVRDVAFAATSTTGWLLGLYEAALLTAAAGDARVALITPEERLLEPFGPTASAAVERAVRDAGIELLRAPHERALSAERLVAAPLLRGRRIDGVPAGEPYRLIETDEFCRVPGLAGVYAIGDITAYPVKQGAVACAQADAAAEDIAAAYGAPLEPAPFTPELRATLLTGRGEPILLNGGQGPDKLPGRRLAPVLAGMVGA
jgi:sulfide:quinone oxidoreductase